jgi:hypothetical protein
LSNLLTKLTADLSPILLGSLVLLLEGPKCPSTNARLLIIAQLVIESLARSGIPWEKERVAELVDWHCQWQKGMLAHIFPDIFLMQIEVLSIVASV